MGQVHLDARDQTVAVQKSHVVRRLVLEEVAKATKCQHDERFRVLRLLDESQHSLDVGCTGITGCEWLICGRVEEVDAEEVHAWECLFEGELQKLVDDFDHLRRDFRTIVVRRGR